MREEEGSRQGRGDSPAKQRKKRKHLPRVWAGGGTRALGYPSGYPPTEDREDTLSRSWAARKKKLGAERLELSTSGFLSEFGL